MGVSSALSLLVSVPCETLSLCAELQEKNSFSHLCLFLSLIYKVPKRPRHITKPLDTTWSPLSGRCPMRPWFGFFGAKHLLYIKVKQYWSPIIPGETERCRLQKTCSVPPIYCLISRLQTLFFFLFFFQRYSSYSGGEGCWGWGLFDKVIYTPLIGPVICLYTARDPINHCSSLDSPVSRWWGLLERGTLFIKSSPWRWFCPNEADVANYYVNETKFSLSGRQTWKFW